MAKVKVTTRFKILELVDRFVDNATANDIGRTLVDAAKDAIASGQSPVRGYGRFDSYKDRKKYPGDLKPARPVNLNLRGLMLEGYGFTLMSNGSVLVGMVKGAQKEKDIASFHQDGTAVMAQRKIVPGPNEEFNVSIMRQLRDVYGKRLAFLIRQANKGE